jgi:hypothetical protein
VFKRLQRTVEARQCQAHRTPLDLQTVYVREEDLQGEDGRTRISLSSWRTSGQSGHESGETDSVTAAQRRRLGHHRAADSCSPLSSPPRPSQSRRAVATWWPAPQRGRSELLTARPTEATSQGIGTSARHTEDSRALAAVLPPSHIVRDPGGSLSREPLHGPKRHHLVPTADFRVCARPLPSRTGALGEGRLLVPCPWIVEPWTHKPQGLGADSQHRLCVSRSWSRR